MKVLSSRVCAMVHLASPPEIRTNKQSSLPFPLRLRLHGSGKSPRVADTSPASKAGFCPLTSSNVAVSQFLAIIRIRDCPNSERSRSQERRITTKARRTAAMVTALRSAAP